MALDPSLGLPVVYRVDGEDGVRDALAWQLRPRRLLSEGFASELSAQALCERRNREAMGRVLSELTDRERRA